MDTWGPPPLRQMTKLFFEMNSYDIRTRIADEGRPPLVPLVHAHEIREGGLVVRDDNVKVTAALVHHPPVTPAFAYRFDAADRSTATPVARTSAREQRSFSRHRSAISRFASCGVLASTLAALVRDVVIAARNVAGVLSLSFCFPLILGRTRSSGLLLSLLIGVLRLCTHLNSPA